MAEKQAGASSRVDALLTKLARLANAGISYLPLLLAGPVLGASVYWFSSLIADRAHLANLKQHLQKLGAQQVRTVSMAQGQKQSRFIAWSFLDTAQREAWRRAHWGAAAG